ncbi:oligosaccharide flippase family protein [Scytonema tolypothrichoides VB-61278]|nr:oligosaccharide flippase family protein [Scytonema tolypothrichoides VB-61278]
MENKRKLLSNSLSVLINRLTQSVVTFILSASIARILGADELGRYLLAFSIYFIFVGIFSAGLKISIVREVAHETDSENISFYLINCSLLQLLLSLFGYVALLITVTLLPYENDTSIICYIVGAAVIPFSLSNMTEAIFQAQERMHLIALSAAPVYVTRLLLMILAMQQGYGLKAVSALFVTSEFLILFVQWFLLTYNTRIKWIIDHKFIVRILKSSSYFFLIDSVTVINSRIEILIISLTGSEFLVGLYGGVVQLMQPFLIIVDSITSAVYPSLAKSAKLGVEQQKKTSQFIIEILLSIALPTSIGFFFFAGDLLEFVYGSPRFREAATVLSIYSLALIIWSFNRPLSYVLMANGLEKVNMRDVSISAALKLGLGLIIVPSYKLIGAVILNLVIYTSTFCQYMYAFYNRLYVINVMKSLRYPLLICLVITPFFVILKKINLNFGITLAILTSIYLIIVGSIAIYEVGGFRAAWARITSK